MPRHHSHSIDFKRRVVAEYHAGETLHALGRRHDPSRNLIRIWIEKAEAGALGHGGAEPTGTLRFAAPSSFAQLHIIRLLPEFQARHPGLTLELRLSDTRFDLIEGSFDLALRSAPLANSSLKGRKLADDPRILCAAPGYLAEAAVPGRPEDLAEHRFIAFGDLGLRELIDADGETWMLDPGRTPCRLVMDDGARSGSQRLPERASRSTRSGTYSTRSTRAGWCASCRTTG